MDTHRVADFNDQESKDIFDSVENQESENIFDSTISVDNDFQISEKKRYYAYVGNFSGLAGLNTAVYIIFNRLRKRYYVGQTINLQARLNSHFQALDKGIHKNGDFQADFNEIRHLKLDHHDELVGSIVFRKFEERIYSVDEINEITKSLIKLESKEIARLVESGEYVYNLTESRGIPCLIDGRFYSSLENARQAVGTSISTDQIKANLANPNLSNWQFARDKDKIDVIPSTDSTVERPVIFTNPYTKNSIRLNSLIECERYFKDNFSSDELRGFRKLKIPISRKRIAQSCSEKRTKYLRFAD